MASIEQRLKNLDKVTLSSFLGPMFAIHALFWRQNVPQNYILGNALEELTLISNDYIQVLSK